EMKRNLALLVFLLVSIVIWITQAFSDSASDTNQVPATLIEVGEPSESMAVIDEMGQLTGSISDFSDYPEPSKRSSRNPKYETFRFLGKWKPSLEVGFGEADISPKLDPRKPVYIAGFGQNRKATKVHDPLFARAVVLQDRKTKIALVSVDLVGFFRPNV